MRSEFSWKLIHPSEFRISFVGREVANSNFPENSKPGVSSGDARSLPYVSVGLHFSEIEEAYFGETLVLDKSRNSIVPSFSWKINRVDLQLRRYKVIVVARAVSATSAANGGRPRGQLRLVHTACTTTCAPQGPICPYLLRTTPVS